MDLANGCFGYRGRLCSCGLRVSMLAGDGAAGAEQILENDTASVAQRAASRFCALHVSAYQAPARCALVFVKECPEMPWEC